MLFSSVQKRSSLICLLVTAIGFDYQKGRRCIAKKCLAFVNRLKQHQPMNTKAFVCILAGAALLVSCAEEQNTTTGTRPNPTPRPRPTPPPPAGKRTEQAGTVIGLTSTQITLRNSAGTWIISRTDSCLQIKSGSVAVGNTVTIIFCEPPSCCPGFPITRASFDVPANQELGPSQLVVVANGIPSAPIAVTVQ